MHVGLLGCADCENADVLTRVGGRCQVIAQRVPKPCTESQYWSAIDACEWIKMDRIHCRWLTCGCSVLGTPLVCCGRRECRVLLTILYAKGTRSSSRPDLQSVSFHRAWRLQPTLVSKRGHSILGVYRCEFGPFLSTALSKGQLGPPHMGGWADIEDVVIPRSDLCRPLKILWEDLSKTNVVQAPLQLPISRRARPLHQTFNTALCS